MPPALVESLMEPPTSPNRLQGGEEMIGSPCPPTRKAFSVFAVPLNTSESPLETFVSAYCQKFHVAHGKLLEGPPVWGLGFEGYAAIQEGQPVTELFSPG